jgi:hypothetical protein
MSRWDSFSNLFHPPSCTLRTSSKNSFLADANFPEFFLLPGVGAKKLIISQVKIRIVDEFHHHF